MSRGPLSLALSFRGDLSLQAHKAAQSGLALAIHHLSKDPQWKGETVLLPSDNQVEVVADQGNLFGLLQDEQGRKTQFLIRFNHQDGPGGADGLPDPAGSHRLQSPLPSVNNCLGTLSVSAPWLGNSTTLGPGTVALLVEGRAGGALQSLTAADSPVVTSGLAVETLHYEFVLAPDLGGPEASLMAGGDIHLKSSGNVEVGVVGPVVRPRLRSKQGIQVVNPSGTAIPLTMEGGEVGFDPTVGFVSVPSPSIVQRAEQVGDNQDMFKLTWADVPKPDPLTSAHLPAGVYITEPGGSLSYYPCSLADYNLNPTQPATPVVLPPGVTCSNGAWSMSAPVAVVPALGATPVKSLCIGSRRSLENWNPSQPTDFLSSSGAATGEAVCSVKLNNTVLCAQDDVQILGNVKGNQSGIVTEGNLVMAATSVEFSVSTSTTSAGGSTTNSQTATPIPVGNQNLTLYVKKNLHLTTHQVQTVSTTTTVTPTGTTTSTTVQDHFGDLSLEGLVYAWGDVTLDSNDKDFSLAGALVAYGGDPALAKPGTSSIGRGNLDITSKNIKLTYDTAKLRGPGGFNPAASGKPFFWERRFFSTK